MSFDEKILSGVVQQVIEQLMSENGSAAAPAACVYDNVDEAVDNAVAAQRRLIAMTLEDRERMIVAMRKTALENNEMLSEMAVKETKLGRYEDKVRENILCATKTPGTEDIQPLAKTGDNGLMLLEYAPVGVIGALTPITNPTGTFIHNGISMLAAGNTDRPTPASAWAWKATPPSPLPGPPARG
jgi:propionaldehyde dehydrogenase